MHDPEILVASVCNPIRWVSNKIRGKDTYSASVMDIWHVDPDRNGSDDSCGYSYPVVSKSDKERLKLEGMTEYGFMFGQSYATLKNATTYEVVYATWRIIAWRMHKRDRLTVKELTYIGDLASNPTDNFQNWVTEAKQCAESCGEFFAIMYRSYLRCNRRWWQHPKFHLFHIGYLQLNRSYDYDTSARDAYFQLSIIRSFNDGVQPELPKKVVIGSKLEVRVSARKTVRDKNDQPYAITLYSIPWPICFMRFNVPLFQRIRRVLFTRCCKCGKGVSWKNWSNMITTQWHRGEHWYDMGERELYHPNCDNPADSGVCKTEVRA